MANTFKFGNEKWAVGKETALAYNDENNNFKPLPFSFDRASSATVVNKNGLIETVGVDEPRIDFLNNTKGHLLLEPSRENKFLQSNQFDTTWILDQVTVTSGQTGVGGSTDAWLLTATSGTGEKKIRQSSPLSGNVAVSVYAKKGTNNYLWLRGVTSGFAIVTWFDLENGQVATDNAVSSEMIDMGNGWYRCIAVFNQDAGWDFHIGNSNQDNQRSVNTTGTIYIQYSQSELGSYATSYIPTSGQSGGVTRSAETISQTPPDGVIGQTEGTIFVDVNLGESTINTSSTPIRFNLNNGVSTENWVFVGVESGDNLRVYVRAGAVSSVNFIKNNVFPSSGNYKIAMSFKSNKTVCYVNGVLQYNADSGVVPNNLNSIGLGGAITNSAVNDKIEIKEYRLYNTALSDSELQTLTT